MATITEDYVSFKTAKLLKEKGFDEATNRYYNAQYDQIRTVSDTFLWHWNDEEFMKRVSMDGAIAIPTLQMAMKWLMEVHNIYISIQPDFPSDKDYKMCWCCSVDILYKDCISTKWYQCYIETYEKACETAILYCLKNLI